jgi:hypothetical protein
MKNLIKKILLQEVEKKYSKPTPNVEKLIYDWLDNYFDGAKMYQIKQYEFSYTFEFCKDGIKIAHLHVEFDDRSPNFGPRDKRPTNERSVDKVKLFIYPVMVDELQSDIPIRKNYLLYLIEEWFEDTKLDEIQKGFNRNDLSLDYITQLSNKKGDLCVPPITKPEGITQQEMMDYIKKNTLFSYKDMEEHEEEEPGWIENTYLQKLHQKESERLNGQ